MSVRITALTMLGNVQREASTGLAAIGDDSNLPVENYLV